MRTLNKLFLSITLSIPVLALAQPYTITDLGTLNTRPNTFGFTSYATGINNSGQVIGYATAGNGQTHAVTWLSGVIRDLGTLGGIESYARSINDAGVIVGFSYTTNNAEQRAVKWDGTGITPLGTLGGRRSEAWSINNLGVIVGDSDSADSPAANAVIWQGATLTKLGNLPEARNFSQALAVNDQGLIAGSSSLPYSGNAHAVLWDNRTIQDIGTVGGVNSSSTAINDVGDVVGISEVRAGSSEQHATLWRGGQVFDLGTLGGNYSYARDINNYGQIVGESLLTGNYSGNRPFLYEGGRMADLNSMMLGNLGNFRTLYSAGGINDQGQIVGSGTTLQGETHAYLLTPLAVPEPASVLLSLLGLGIIFPLRRKSEKPPAGGDTRKRLKHNDWKSGPLLTAIGASERRKLLSQP